MNATFEYPRISKEELPRWESWIEGVTGITLRGHKRVLERCIYPRLLACGVPTLEEYQRLVESGEQGSLEKAALIDELTVKDSRFFRNIAAMNAVGDFLREENRQSYAAARRFKIWSVGCSLGQETWSLAMIASEQLGGSRAHWEVLGTDISPSAVTFAARGSYSEKQVAAVSDTRLSRFMKLEEADWKIRSQLRERVAFGSSNLINLESCPYTDMDVIYCQNVLIYFREDTANRILEQLVRRLQPGGLLVLGAGEAPNWGSSDVTRWRPETVNAYRKCTRK
ncbi:protein-glutamate O-methyltransferase CheR [Halieaceae bacterium IMCC14734]|uniref:protein-glutamate O-methyltransferase n=1 Tax=Candidatus Litorirhabdus singularis TaxID=2518993 RepID=A0ABT3TDP0_9GAMM|nr:protein-glutamate O-methyltransferase CheR [Candidatus Litorirhabdus singularis]MCX2980426.1 protein-glutamate O-methyltransferase CheR [Candidatus Litorirhabdus singularis]